MQQLAELIPIALFFTVFFMKGETVNFAGFHHEIDGIYSATAVLMIATTLQVLLTWLITKRVEKRLWLLFAVVIITGALTLILHNKIFIQWKPTIFNWALALIFIGSTLIGDRRNLLERTLGAQLKLPSGVWSKLNGIWVIYFIIVGALNLLVAYNFSEDAWVSYKLYSAIGFTLALSIITALLISPHLKEDESKQEQ
jgi:intracellular septation protein